MRLARGFPRKVVSGATKEVLGTTKEVLVGITSRDQTLLLAAGIRRIPRSLKYFLRDFRIRSTLRSSLGFGKVESDSTKNLQIFY